MRDSSELELMEVGIPVGSKFFASDTESVIPQAVVEIRTKPANVAGTSLDFKLLCIIRRYVRKFDPAHWGKCPLSKKCTNLSYST